MCNNEYIISIGFWLDMKQNMMTSGLKTFPEIFEKKFDGYNDKTLGFLVVSFFVLLFLDIDKCCDNVHNDFLKNPVKK